MNIHCQYCQCPRSTENEYICQPTDADACVACQRVAELDAKLERMREAIADLERERQRWKVQVNANHDKLTRRVPPEIVASILKFSLPENVTTLNLQYVTSMSTLGAPLVLSAVSRRWRDIAHSTPQLWTDVPLHLVESNYHSLPTLATDWMNKSGQCPLSINICVPKNETEQALDLIRVVNQFSSQWIHLQYHGISSNMSAFSSNADSISQLQSLSLRTTFCEKLGRFDLKTSTLRLTHLVLDSIFFIRAVNIHWDNITELVITSYICVNDCLQILSSVPHVKKCSLAIPQSIFFSQVPSPREPILLRDLLYFKLAGCYCPEIFAHLLCPSLEQLTIEDVEDSFHGSESTPYDSMIRFLQNSGSFVRALSLKNALRPEDDIMLICQEMPSLHHLHIELSKPSIMQLGNVIFSLLAQTSSISGEIKPLYLPDLHSLSIHQDKIINCSSFPAMFNLSDEGKLFRDNFRSVELVFKEESPAILVTNLNQDTMKKLLRLKEGGIEVNIHVGRDKMI